MERSTYIVKRGTLTQYGDDGKARVFREGDTIELTDAEAVKLGSAVAEAVRPPDPLPLDDNDDDV